MQPMVGQEFGIRSFVAISPPAQAKERLEDAVRKWTRRIGTQGVKWVNPANFHMTLEFLGSVRHSAVDDLRARLRGFLSRTPVVECALSGAGCFPDPARPKVMWIGLTGDLAKLDELRAAVEEATKGYGEPRDEKPFHPHLTVARFDWLSREQIGFIRRACENKEETDFGPWRVDRVDLMRSELGPGGSKYTVLESIELLA
jgi:2'-5' RNA ligase